MAENARESAELLLGEGVRFLVTNASPNMVLEANAAFTEMTGLSPYRYRGAGIGILHCRGTNVVLFDETLSKAGCGLECACGVVLTQHELLLHIQCLPVLHSVHGRCILCIAMHVSPPAAPGAAALISSTAPFQVLDSNPGWSSLFDYSSDEMADGGLRLLQGPLSNDDRFEDMFESFRTCVHQESVLVAYRRDGSHALVYFRLFPVLGAHPASDRAVTVVLEANLLTSFSNATHQQELPLESMVGGLSLSDHAHPSCAATVAASRCPSPPPPPPASSYKDYSEVVFLPPPWALELCAHLLAELQREGLVLHWMWVQAGLCVWAKVEEVRRRAERAALCRTGMSCLWLLGLTQLSTTAAAATFPAAAAAVAAAAGRSCDAPGASMVMAGEAGTDFGFLAR